MHTHTRTRMQTRPWTLLALLTTALLIASAGCSKDDDKNKMHTQEGRVASINTETGIMEMWVYSPKHKEEVRFPGRLSPNAEILVNGAVASVQDVRVDDKVLVTAREVREGADRQFLAVRVEVQRPVTQPAASTTKEAS